MKKNENNKSVLLKYVGQILKQNNFKKVYFGHATPVPNVAVELNYLSRITIPIEGKTFIIAAYDGKISKKEISSEKILFTGRKGWAYSTRESPYVRSLSIVFMESYIRLVYAESVYDKNLYRSWHHTLTPPHKISKNIIECLNAIMFENDRTRQARAILFINSLLHQVVEEVENDSLEVITKAEKTFKNIIEYTQQYYHSPINRASVSADLQLSPSYLSRTFKEHSGQNFNSYLNKLRMEKAELILKNYDLSVEQVAEQCGFTNCDYFSKALKKHFGITPGFFRSAHK